MCSTRSEQLPTRSTPPVVGHAGAAGAKGPPASGGALLVRIVVVLHVQLRQRFLDGACTEFPSLLSECDRVSDSQNRHSGSMGLRHGACMISVPHSVLWICDLRSEFASIQIQAPQVPLPNGACENNNFEGRGTSGGSRRGQLGAGAAVSRLGSFPGVRV